MAIETISVHKACSSQLIRVSIESLFCGVCNHPVEPNEIIEVDNSPSDFAG